MVVTALKEIALLGFASFCAGVAQGIDIAVNDCSDLTSLADALAGNDVTATFADDITCEDAWTTITVPTGRLLTVEADQHWRGLDFTNVRFKVEERDDVGDYDLIFSPDVKFLSTIGADSDPDIAIQDVNGGVLEVLSGAAVHFEGYSTNIGIEIVSAREESEDYSDHFVNGGAWYNEGRILIDGGAHFMDCDNSGGGESPPGNGGAVYNSESGRIDFLGGAEFDSNSCRDNFGGYGAGIYNAGTIVVSTSAVLKSNSAESGGGIFNDVGGYLSFETEDTTVVFYDNGADNDRGGNILNYGTIYFASYVNFLEGDHGIYTTGHIAFLDGGLFTNLPYGAISATQEATFEGLDDLVFVNNGEASTRCPDITMYQDGEYVCLP